MSGKAAIPLILGAGAVALLLTGKKKSQPLKGTEKVEPGETPSSKERELLEKFKYIEMISDPDGDERLILDEECSSIINKLNFETHNNWLTNRYFQLMSEGVVGPDQISIQLLKDQSSHCPWDDKSSWTPLMQGLYDQLNAAVVEWNRQTGGKVPFNNG